jgi:signal recognition particle subunit SEC65
MPFWTLVDLLDGHERRALVLWLRYCVEPRRTLRAIGAEFGVTVERARQIEHKALRELGLRPKLLVVNREGFPPKLQAAVLAEKGRIERARKEWGLGDDGEELV